MGRSRRGTAIWGIGALALVLWACETTRNINGQQDDVTPPVISLTNSAGDTQDISGGLRFNINAADNLSLKSIDLTFSGGLIATLDTTFITTTKTYAVSRQIPFPSGSGAGGSIMVVGRATDGRGNFAEDTVFVFLSNVQALRGTRVLPPAGRVNCGEATILGFLSSVQALRVTLVLPSPGALASTGKGIPVDVIAVQNSGIAKFGFLVSPATSVSNPTTPPNDSLVFTAPFADSVEYVDTLIVVPSSGTFQVIGIAEDSARRRRRPSGV